MSDIMFHVFQSHGAITRPNKRSSRNLQEKSRSRSVKIPHACMECKRRKIRCDGGHPCSKCISRDVGSSCTYTRQRERIHPSKKKIDGLSRALEEHRTIVDRLFPEHQISELLSLPRHDLIDILIISDQASTPTSMSNSWLSRDQESVATGTSWLSSPPPDISAFDGQQRASTPLSLSNAWTTPDHEFGLVRTSWLPSPPPDLAPFDIQEKGLNPFLEAPPASVGSAYLSTEYTWATNDVQSFLTDEKIIAGTQRWQTTV